MTPKCAFLLALMGVAVAGAPLRWLTRPAPLADASLTDGPQAPPTSASDGTLTEQPGGAGELTAVYARVQFTGMPQVLRLSMGGELLAELSPEAAAQLPEPGVWEPVLMLPVPITHLELEVKAQWESESPQAVTVSLEPPKQQARQMTLWSLPGGMLYDWCPFEW